MQTAVSNLHVLHHDNNLSIPGNMSRFFYGELFQQGHPEDTIYTVYLIKIDARTHRLAKII